MCKADTIGSGAVQFPLKKKDRNSWQPNTDEILKITHV